MEKWDEYLVEDTSEAEKYIVRDNYAIRIPFLDVLEISLIVSIRKPKEWNMFIYSKYNDVRLDSIDHIVNLPGIFRYGLRTGAFSNNATAPQEFLAKKMFIESLIEPGMKIFGSKTRSKPAFPLELLLCKVALYSDKDFASKLMQFFVNEITGGKPEEIGEHLKELRNAVDWAYTQIPWYNWEYDIEVIMEEQVAFEERVDRNLFSALYQLDLPFETLKSRFPEFLMCEEACKYSKFPEVFTAKESKIRFNAAKNIHAAREYEEFLQITSVGQLKHKQIITKETSDTFIEIADHTIKQAGGKNYKTYLAKLEEALHSIVQNMNIDANDRKVLVDLALLYGQPPKSVGEVDGTYEITYNLFSVDEGRVKQFYLAIPMDLDPKTVLDIIRRFKRLERLVVMFINSCYQPMYYRDRQIEYKCMVTVKELGHYFKKIKRMRSLKYLKYEVFEHGDGIEFEL